MKIKKITLQTASIHQLKDFYSKTLGLKLLQANEESFSCEVGSSILEFSQAQHIHPTYHFAFNIPENQILEAQDWLKSKNIELLPYNENEIIDFPNWNAHALYFLDASGNIVELIARHDVQNTTAKSFSSESLLAISEIGLPAEAIEPFYQEIQSQWKVPMYSTISNLTSFCAAGDTAGLLIIVPLQRAWFPTEILNGIYPTKIEIEGENGITLIFEKYPYVIHSRKSTANSPQ